MAWANLTTLRDSLRTGYWATIVDYNKMNKLSRPNNRWHTIGPNCLKVVETKTQALNFHLIKVEVGDCDHPISPYTSTASKFQRWRQQNLTAKDSHCPSINIIHHNMECIVMAFRNVCQCINMSLIDIEICICREIYGVMGPFMPLVNGSIQLR